MKVEDFDPLLTHLPPKTAAALLAAIRVYGERVNMPPEWVQQWVAFMLVADALARYALEGNCPFELKGGAAIELRLRHLAPADKGGPKIQPRATRDLDATFHGEIEAIQDALDAALENGNPNFAFRLVPEAVKSDRMRRYAVHVSYVSTQRGTRIAKSFSRVKLEVSAYEGTRLPPEMVPAFPLKPLGIDGPEELPCIPLRKQIAQKLHAVTEGPNDRFRDLLDIVMLSAFEPPSPELRAVCEETFRIRAGHGWPPEVVTYPDWIAPLEERAREMRLDQQSADEIVAYVTDYVRKIAVA
jgi:hypothetical protein